MISLKNIEKSYTIGSKSLKVLQGINIDIRSGEMVSIMGASGSGKSTLLNIIGLLDNFDMGEYHLAGVDMSNLDDNKGAMYRNQYIGFVFQAFNLLPFKTAWENVALPLYYRGVDRRERKDKAFHYLEKVGLIDWADHLPNQMSGGQKQRVAIARAMSNTPKIILADEPTGALDSKTTGEIIDLFHEIHDNGMTIIVVTHENDVAKETERLILLKDGKIV